MKRILFVLIISCASISVFAQSNPEGQEPTAPSPVPNKSASDLDGNQISESPTGAVQMENNGFRKFGAGALNIYTPSLPFSEKFGFWDQGFLNIQNQGGGQFFGLGVNVAGQLELISNSFQNDQAYGTAQTRMLIDDETGHIGVGVLSPEAPLHIRQVEAGSSPIMGSIMIGETSSYHATMDRNEVNAWNDLDGTSYYINYANDGDVILAYGGGNVGLGLSNPTEKLQVRSGNILVESGATDKVLIQNAGAGSGGEVTLYTNSGVQSLEIRASDSPEAAGEILMYNPANNQKTMELDGNWGGSGKSRIVVDELQITGGSDLSEYFSLVSKDMAVEAGTVLSVSENGSANLEISKTSYDKKVVGVVSGANGVNTGLMLQQRGSEKTDGELPVAIAGRVYVKAEAFNQAIYPGDLLTTSEKAGFAQKVKSHRKAKGAVIGKALTGLESGEGFVLVLLGVK